MSQQICSCCKVYTVGSVYKGNDRILKETWKPTDNYSIITTQLRQSYSPEEIFVTVITKTQDGSCCHKVKVRDNIVAESLMVSI